LGNVTFTSKEENIESFHSSIPNFEIKDVDVLKEVGKY